METKKIDYRAIIIVALAVAAVVVLFALRQKKSSVQSFESAGLEVGRPAPDFKLPDLDGKVASLSDYRDKVVLVNIWATWCPPCVDEMPSLEKLYQKLKSENFQILAVSIDAAGADTVAPFMIKNNLTFPALVDPQGTTRNIFKTTGVPESFIINRQGLLIKKIIGPLDWASPEVLEFFRQLLQNSTP